MSRITAEQALAVLREAELLCTPEQVDAALDRLATAVTARLEGRDPLVLMVVTNFQDGVVYRQTWLPLVNPLEEGAAFAVLGLLRTHGRPFRGIGAV